MKVIDHDWLSKQLETCNNRFDSTDDFESVEREQILRAYYGSERKQVSGRSNIVSRDLMSTLETMMPELVKPFVSRNDSFFRLMPTTAENAENAEHAEEAIRYILKKNDEYSIVNTWFKNSLLYSIGVVKFFVDDNVKILTHCYEDLNEVELQTLIYSLNSKNELVVKDNIEVIGDIEETEEGLYDVMFQERIEKSPNIVVEALPPEEFLYPAAAASIADAPIVAHVYYLPDYELIKRGFDPDIVAKYSATKIDSTEQQERERKSTLATQEAQGLEGDFVRVTEAYIRAEETGEMRQVIALGTALEIVKDVGWPYRLPFAVITPFPMPNQISGLGLWNLIEDVQLTKTQLIRQGLDNHQRTNDNRMAIKAGSVDINGIQNSIAGGVIQCDDPTRDIVPIVPPSISNNVLNWLTAVEDLKNSRIGSNNAMSGLDPNALAGVSNIVAAQAVKSGTNKLEYIARNFAETGMKDLVLGLLEIISVTHPEGMKFHGSDSFVNYVPNDDDVFDYDITVGLGSIGEEQNIAQLTMIAEQQYKFIEQLGLQNPAVPLTSYVKTLHKIIKAAGYKNPDDYFSMQGAVEIQMSPPAKEKEDPLVDAQVVASKAEIEISKDKLQADINETLFKHMIEQKKLDIKRLELQLKNKEIDRKIEADMNKNEIEEDKVAIEKSKND